MNYESSLAKLGLDEEDIAGASQNVGYLKWRWNNQSAVSIPRSQWEWAQDWIWV